MEACQVPADQNILEQRDSYRQADDEKCSLRGTSLGLLSQPRGDAAEQAVTHISRGQSWS